MKKFRLFFLLNLLILTCYISAYSQSNESVNNAESQHIKSDTNQISKNYLTKSPTIAIIWSLIFPGGGQIYVGSYWKAPIFAIAVSALTYNAIHNHNLFKDLEIQNNPNKEIYRNNRDISIFFICGVYVLSAIDAYVGAHLYDFDVSDDLSFNITSDSINLISLKFVLRLK